MNLLDFLDDIDTGWRHEAKCTGMDNSIFFPGPGQSQKEAVAICDSCPARLPCLEFALGNEERYGIWGGLNELQRRDLRNRRKLASNKVNFRLTQSKPAADDIDESDPRPADQAVAI